MSFDIYFFSRDYTTELDRSISLDEANGILHAMQSAGWTGNDVQDEYHFEAEDGASVEYYGGQGDPSGMLALRGLLPGHAKLMFDLCEATDWVMVAPRMDDGMALVATKPFTAMPGSVFLTIGAEEPIAQVADTPRALWDAVGGAFDEWRDWVDRDFDEQGRKQNEEP